MMLIVVYNLFRDYKCVRVYLLLTILI